MIVYLLYRTWETSCGDGCCNASGVDFYQDRGRYPVFTNKEATKAEQNRLNEQRPGLYDHSGYWDIGEFEVVEQ